MRCALTFTCLHDYTLGRQPLSIPHLHPFTPHPPFLLGHIRIICSQSDNGNSGECATHFQQHLQKYPPQVSSRNAAAGWACFIHNEVNTMLDKPEFDCTKLGEFYDCGCDEDEDKDGDGKDGENEGVHHATASRSEAHKSEDHGLLVEISREASVTPGPPFLCLPDDLLTVIQDYTWLINACPFLLKIITIIIIKPRGTTQPPRSRAPCIHRVGMHLQSGSRHTCEAGLLYSIRS